MSGEGAAARCEQTGLAVAECSCRDCLETMLAEFSPDLLDGEISSTSLVARRARLAAAGGLTQFERA